jgi:hypothetical protein
MTSSTPGPEQSSSPEVEDPVSSIGLARNATNNRSGPLSGENGLRGSLRRVYRSVLTPRVRAIASRWADAILTSFVAAAVFVLGAPRLIDLVEHLWPSILDWQGFALATLWCALLVLARRLGLLGTAGMRKARVNPPPWLQACLAMALVLALWIWWPSSFPRFFYPLRHDELFAARWVLLGGLTLSVSTPMLAGLLADRRRSGNADSSGPPINLASGDLPRIRAWLRTDDEIADPIQDAFGHNHLALRLADRLVDAGEGDLGHGATFALVGELGSGKSSVRQLVRHRLRERGLLDSRIVLVDVSLWPFETADAAIRAILTRIEGGLARLTCVASVGHAADRYLRVVEKLDSRLAAVSALLPEQQGPQDILSAYDRLAQLLGVQLVVWIEDLERFEGVGTDLITRSAPVRGLLHGLQQFDHITVVLASNSLDARIDLEKIARFVERLPRFSTLDAWPIIRRFRQVCLTEARASGLALALDPTHGPLAEEYSSEMDSLAKAFAIGMSERDAIVALCRTPRMLKQTLRAALDVWDRLRGEIDFDDVLLISVIRVCRPEIFSLVEYGIGFLQNGAERGGAGKSDVVATQFQASLNALLTHDIVSEKAINRILDFIFPARNGGQTGDDRSKLQGLGGQSGEYWRRYLAMEVPPDGNDQDVIAAIQEWNEERSKVLVAIISSPGTSGIVERFGRLVSDEGVLRLMEEVAKDRLTDDPAKWPEGVFPGHRPPPGVAPLWRIIRQPSRGKLIPESDLVASLRRVFATCVPVRLGVAHEFVHLFLAQDDAVSSLLSKEATAAVILELEAQLRGYLDRAPLDLAAALTGSEPQTLAWVCWRIDRIRRKEHFAGIPFEGWAGFSKLVLRAADEDPLTMIPQLLPFVLSHEVDPFARRNKDRAVFQADAAERLFGLSALAELLASHPPDRLPGLPADTAVDHSFVRVEIAKVLKARSAGASHTGGMEPGMPKDPG